MKVGFLLPRRVWVGHIRSFVRSAPLTFTWLLVLMATTSVAHSLTSAQIWMVLADRSTNIHHLATDPLRVLFTSLLWLDGRHWWPYVPLFCVFLAPAERWLGSMRWLLVGLTAHIGATYLSEGALYWAIRRGSAAPTLVDARDIGVSYFVVGVAAILAWHTAIRWRVVYLIAGFAIFAAVLAVAPTFTSLGHLCAFLIGLALYPISRTRRAPQWDPTSFVADLLSAIGVGQGRYCQSRTGPAMGQRP